MFAGVCRWCAGLLATALVAGSAARGQDYQPAGPDYPPTAADSAEVLQNYQFVSNAEDKAETDLSKRVADLEKALKKMADKEAADKKKAASKPTVTVFGRAFVDTVLFNENAASQALYGDQEDGVFFRSARLGAKGTMFEIYEYQVEMDFAGRTSDGLTPTTSFIEQVNFKDTYLQINDLPLAGSVRIGHFREPFSLEELTSGRSITFMERALLNALVPSRNIGIMAFDHNEAETVTWQAGAFRLVRENPPFVQDDDGGCSFAARTTWLAWYDEGSDGRGLLHLGMGYRYQDADDPTLRVSARPEANIGPRVADATLTGLEDFNELGPELAFVYGPFSVQSEWVGSWFNRAVADTYFNGYYVQASYFLTGEHRPYDRLNGRLDRIKPLENFFRVRACDGCVETGWGAWEVAYRYSYLDLNDPASGITGGVAVDHTVGLNWYLNPYMRMMFNYVHSNSYDRTLAGRPPEAPLDLFEMRAQLDF